MLTEVGTGVMSHTAECLGHQKLEEARKPPLTGLMGSVGLLTP